MAVKSPWPWRLLSRFILALLLVASVAPVYIVVSNSFRRTLDISTMPPQLVFTPILTHYQRLLSLDNFARYFMNSVIISVSAAATVLVFGTLAGYGMRLFRSRVGVRFTNLLLLGKLVPAITIIIPLYIMLNRIGLTGTYLGPILAHAAMSVPFITWLMTSFIRDIPGELLESGRVEGCGRMTIFARIVFPLLAPAVASAIILSMTSSWNELMFSLQLTGIDTYPLTVGVARYVGAISVDWGKTSAAATVSMVPIIVVGFFMQRYLVTGLTAGAVKG
jgi:ABC-type glycerol-3-phosphate transport system permease component